MVIHGDAADAGEVIEFRMFNVNSGETATVSGTPVSFLTDRRLGQLTSPYVLNHDEANFENGYFLSQNLPNPFSDQTTIDFTIPREEEVHLTLRNQYGGEVRVLVNEVRQPGNYRVVMQRKDLPSGMYQYVFKSGNYTKTRKLVIIR
jgi:5-hydroxyisourate hydrolase-like protein (transthyretin family)